MKTGLLFPGQGSQEVGMAADLRDIPEARAVLEEADEVLGIPLTGIMFEGPESVLVETRNAQPALLTHSIAVYRAVAGRVDPVSLAAGHSLGEFSAHVAAGTLSFADALVAVRLRGELMFEAGARRPGAMAAVLGLSDEEVIRVCAGIEDGTCVPANFNTEGQVVVSGDTIGVEMAMAAATKAGARRVVPLNVSGAFHSPLMEEAEEGLREHLEGIEFSDPAFPVMSNVTARPVTGGEEARALLVQQLTSPVRWAASVGAMLDEGVERFFELGPGSVLCGLNRRIARRVPCASVRTNADIEGLEASPG